MINDDFAFNSSTGHFSADVADSIIGEVVLLLSVKSKSSTFPGDWFFNHVFGNTCYKIKTITADVLNRVKNSIELSLTPILSKPFVQSIDVTPQYDRDNPRRINVIIVISQNAAEPITYTHFVEVGS